MCLCSFIHERISEDFRLGESGKQWKAPTSSIEEMVVGIGAIDIELELVDQAARIPSDHEVGHSYKILRSLIIPTTYSPTQFLTLHILAAPLSHPINLT